MTAKRLANPFRWRLRHHLPIVDVLPISLEGPVSAGNLHGRWYLQAGILCVYLGPDLKRMVQADGRPPQEQAAEVAHEKPRMH